MPTFRDAIATFRAKAAAGEIVNRKTGKPGEFKKSRIGPVISNTTAAVRHAAKALHGGRELGEADLLNVELDPLFMVLPHHAAMDAREAEPPRVDPLKEAANVRLFVSAVLGRDIERDRQPVTEAKVPDAWRPLYDAVVAAGESKQIKETSVRSYKRAVLKCAELMLKHGIARPEDMPDDYDRINEMGNEVGWDRKEIAYVLTAYRKAADWAGRADLPRAHEIVDKNGMGFKSLPDYPQRLAAAGYTGDPRTISTVDGVVLLAPRLGAALVKTNAEGRKNGRSRTWEDAREQCANTIVATLLRGDVPDFPVDRLKTLTWLDLWRERYTVDAPADTIRDSQMDEIFGDSPIPAATRSLMHLILDAAAPRSWANSPLKLHKAEYESDAVPVYTEKLLQHLDAAWMITVEFFAKEAKARNEELWRRCCHEYEDLKEHAVDYNTPRVLTGRKKKDSLAAGWPQMVCMGLPHLAGRCHELRRQITARLFRKLKLDSRDSRSLVLEYDEALRAYVTTAFALDDGLRLAQYANGMVGEQVVPTFARTANGEPIAIARIETRWSSLDNEAVQVKVKEKNGETNSRTREMTMSFFDRTLLWDYWTQTRPRALVAAGLLGSIEDWDIENDHWPLIVNWRPQVHQVVEYHTQQAKYEEDLARLTAGNAGVRPERPVWRGNLGEDTVTEVFGRALHDVAVNVLGRDLPDYNDPKLVDEHRALFAMHITRTMIGCYFGGIRGDWSTAVHLTNDNEMTLRTHYNVLQKSFDQMARRDDWEKPTWFDAVIDRALKANPADDWSTFWREFDPMKPGECLARMVAGAPKKKVSPPKRRSGQPA